MSHYREMQSTWPWLFLLLLGVTLITIFIPIWVGVHSGHARETAGLLAPTVIAVVLMPLVLNLMCLRTDVEREQVYVRLGCLFPMMWRRLPLDTIAEVRVVHYRPLRDAGGWGYRLGRFEGTKCWYYTMRGNRGVLIVTDDNRQHIIGSQDPEALARAIRRAQEGYKEAHKKDADLVPVLFQEHLVQAADKAVDGVEGIVAGGQAQRDGGLV